MSSYRDANVLADNPSVRKQIGSGGGVLEGKTLGGEGRGTHVSADDLPDVHLLDFWLELTKIPHQRAHARRQRMHAVDEVSEGNVTCKHKDTLDILFP